MKTITIVLISICFLSVPGLSQEWKKTNLTTVNYLAITDIESYNNNLYGILFSGFSSEFYAMKASSNVWEQITLNNIDGYASLLESFDGKLYMASTLLGSAMIYTSEDNGTTFTPDTTGLPKASGDIAPIYGLTSYGDLLIANLGSAGYWGKRSGQNSWYYFNTPTGLNGGVDPITCFQGTLIAFDNSGNNSAYKSSDYGITWNTLDGNLNLEFTAYTAYADQTTGRFYFAGGKESSAQTQLYYSDDSGKSWAQIDLASFITTDYLGEPQLITALYSQKNKLYIALENDEKNSVPIIITSEQNDHLKLAANSEGLPLDASGRLNAIKFLEHNNKIFVAMNYVDVFYQEKDVQSGKSAWAQKVQVQIYPNPANNTLYIAQNHSVKSIQIFGTNGEMIKRIEAPGKQLDISFLNKGSYYLQIEGTNTTYSSIPFLKN